MFTHATIPLKKNHLLYILCAGEFFERFAYFGTMIVVVLYFSKHFQFSDEASYALYDIYVFLMFATPVFGGVLADRFLGLSNAIMLGILLLITGNLLLVLPSLDTTYYGLALTILGTALYKPTATGIIGISYDKQPDLRERAYTILYMAINAGATLGPLIYGLFIKDDHWHGGFFCSAIGMMLGGITLLIKLPRINQLIKESSHIQISKLRILLTYIILLIAVQGITLLLHNTTISNWFFGLFILGFIVLLVWIVHQSVTIERQRIIGITVLSFFCVFFFCASLQVGSSITLFIERNIDRYLWGWQIPTPFFSALDPLFVVLTAPLFSLLWYHLKKKKIEPHAITKLVIGLLIASLSFLCFAITTQIAANYHYLSLLGIVLGNLFLGSGEICLMPAMLSIISYFSPRRLKATMMGILFLFIACAGYLSGVLAQIKIPLKQIGSIQINTFSSAFLTTMIVTSFVAICLTFLKPTIQKLLAYE